MQLAWQPSTCSLGRVLATVEHSPLTYLAVGASGGPAPGAYSALEQVSDAGVGHDAWSRVGNALLDWGLHREAGMRLASTGPAGRPGATVVNAALFGPVAVLAPCRVVAVIDEPHRRGFAYGSLPGHPLSGEEQFTVELEDDGRVRLRIRSFSRPVGLAALSPAAARTGQRLVNRRYAAAARRLAA